MLIPEVELLAPAGNWDCAKAAVENGADAIYFGLETGFNARARAANFGLDQLDELIDFLHQRGVRGYVTLNTLVFADELPRFQEHAIAVAKAGVDAVLVQDLGAALMIRHACPDLELHASTQMTLSSPQGLTLAAEMGLARTVVPRELSVNEISTLSVDAPMGIEAFVHGALCVAYSGQCLTSESLGGRSANRGQCAQACRLPYEVICDGLDVDLDKVKYLLSPQDLAAYELIPQMLEAGVRSFKIEGRLKSPEYVANTTSHYRRALDAAIQQAHHELSPQDVEELELSFSRGFSAGWLQGCDHKALVPGLSSAKRGVLLGNVRDSASGWLKVELQRQLQVGDGIVLAGDRLANQEQGGRVVAIRKNRQRLDAASSGICEIRLHQDVNWDNVIPQQQIWKTDDPQLTKRLRATFKGSKPRRRIALDLEVRAAAGEPLEVRATAENGNACAFVDVEPLPVARRQPLTEDVLRRQLGRLGNSVYVLRQLKSMIQGQPMAPLSFLGRVRHELLHRLEERQEKHTCVTDPAALSRLRNRVRRPVSDSAELQLHVPRLHVLCRYLYQLEPVLQAGVDSVYVDFQDLREYAQALQIAGQHDTPLCLATPRIEKPGELGIFKMIEKQARSVAPQGVLVRNLGGLAHFRDLGWPCVADFSLNAANDLTVGVLRDWGAQRVTVSYDLNRDQMLEMMNHCDNSHLEVVIHQHMPMFHMEHCVFCAVLSPGTNKTNCGRPCDDHKVQLRDRIGMEHPLHADIGCRNTLYNATPQSAAEITSLLVAKGVRDFRIELLEDKPAQATKIVSIYQNLLAGKLPGHEVWQQLKAANRVGVTRGTMEQRRDPLAII